MKNLKRKIILNLAISLDGYIADPDGGFNWIVGDGDKNTDSEKQFHFSDFLKEIDTIVMGRKAYDDTPAESLDSYGDKTIYVATSEPLETKSKNLKSISGDVAGQILKAKRQEGKDIWIYGGGELADQFIKADIIDEYIIGIIPIILGKGIPLFLTDNPTIKLHLTEHTSQEGIVVMKYTKI